MRRLLLVAPCLAIAMLVAACSSDGSGQSGGGAAAGGGAGSADSSSGSARLSSLTTITVGTSPTISNVGLYEAGKSGGSMAANNLAMTPKVVNSGAQALPLLLNGQLQFTAADPVGVMTAISHGVPLVVVAAGNSAASSADHDSTGLVVKPSSGLGNNGADYSGKKIGVNALNSLSELVAKEVIDKSGGDSSKVEFVELPISQMTAAVTSGTVDGVVTAEPFLSQAEHAGLKVAYPVFSMAIPGVPQLVYVASQSYVKSHPDVVRAFADAVAKANSSLENNDAEIRAIAKTSTATSASDLNSIILPVFSPPTVSSTALRNLQSLMVKYGALKDAFPIAPHLFCE